MRQLSDAEIAQALDDNGESGDGCIAIEATILELAGLRVGTCCGNVPNEAFKDMLRDEFGGRGARGWYRLDMGVVSGMFHIECDEDEARCIGAMADDNGGSLLASGASGWPGFYEFEIE